jgi:arylsulfatase A-like enzyme
LLDGDTAYLARGNFGPKKTEYAHDLFTERALQFLDRKDDRPFFLKLAYTIPHANNELGRATGNGMEVPSTDPYTNENWPAPDKNFAAMVARLDADVGKVLAKLTQTGRDANTLVIFTSDNGPHREGGHDPELFNDNGPLRGIKRDLYEGGIRVPFLALWPSVVPAGQVSEHVAAFWDFLPTAAEIAGQPKPAGVDGISILPALQGRAQPGHEYLYWEFHERGFQQAVRMGYWKGVRTAPGKPVELYDLRSDLGEQADVAASHADVVRQVERWMREARTESADWPVRA